MRLALQAAQADDAALRGLVEGARENRSGYAVRKLLAEHGAAKRFIARAAEDARAVIADSSAAVAARIEALDRLSFAPYEEAAPSSVHLRVTSMWASVPVLAMRAPVSPLNLTPNFTSTSCGYLGLS